MIAAKCDPGKYMIKAYAIAIILCMSIGFSCATDWLEGGYVRSEDSGDIGQYFTDPLFTPKSGHPLSSDPSIRDMQISLDMPRPSATAGLTAPFPDPEIQLSSKTCKS